MFNYLIVGAGFAGSVLAERLASQEGASVLIVDKRPHIGGNAYDYYDAAGVLVHRYGPQVFHTDSKSVFDYLSQFTTWRPYEHRVLTRLDDGQSLSTTNADDCINARYGVTADASDSDHGRAKISKHDSRVWRSDPGASAPEEDSPGSLSRGSTWTHGGEKPLGFELLMPTTLLTPGNRDGRYYDDAYQVMPQCGYTRMFERMLANPKIKVMLNTDYREITEFIPFRTMIYTGSIDEFFDYQFGRLPYYSVDFRFETVDTPTCLPVGTVNLPQGHRYARVTEFKHLTGQRHAQSTLAYEVSHAGSERSYPVLQAENRERYAGYEALARDTEDVHFTGRLATYQYVTMGRTVEQSLKLYESAFRSSRRLNLDLLSAVRSTKDPIGFQAYLRQPSHN